MPPGNPRRAALTRADLPTDLTPDSLRQLDFQTLRQLARRGNGVLTDEEQEQFDTSFREVMRGTASFLNSSLQRSRDGGPAGLDPALRRSYARMQQRLAEQARRAQQRYPELDAETRVATVVEPGPTAPELTSTDDASPDSVQAEVEQTSETLDMLERIASLQQQVVQHQSSQLLSETRGLFFAFVVSVAVIIAGVAPVVEADGHDRLLIGGWTLGIVVLAGLVYLAVRNRQQAHTSESGE